MELVKKAAEIKNDEQPFLQIRDIDLIAKKMQMHGICYMEYTRIITLKSKPSEADETEFKCGEVISYVFKSGRENTGDGC